MTEFQMTMTVDKSRNDQSRKFFQILPSQVFIGNFLNGSILPADQYGPLAKHFMAIKQIVCFQFPITHGSVNFAAI
jgi:hypothetical protein